MFVTCQNPKCQKVFLQKNRLHKFCSYDCRDLGMIDFGRVKEVEPIAEINRLAFSCAASFARLGLKITQEVRYFPAGSVKVPLHKLPALPRPGHYVLQLFDALQNPLCVEETVLLIQGHHITEFCRFTEGIRSRLIPGTEP